MMQSTRNHDIRAYSQFANDLSEALARFAARIEAMAADEYRPVPVAANDNEPAEPPVVWPHDPMSLNEVRSELRLTGPQIEKLRGRWGFPNPVERDGKLAFSRAKVERWGRIQPNQHNLAAVLRLRRRRMFPSA